MPELEQAAAAALMVILRGWVEVCCGELASDTATVKEYVPGVAVGKPEIAPVVGLSANPVGNPPVVTVQPSGGEPPVATSCPWYAVPTVPSNSEVVRMVSGPEGFIVMEKVELM